MSALLGVLAWCSVGCGGASAPKNVDLSRFVGTWNVVTATANGTCSDGTSYMNVIKESDHSTRTDTWTLGTTTDLVDHETARCSFGANVKGATASYVSGQQCEQAAERPISLAFTVSDDDLTATEDSVEAFDEISGATTVTCQVTGHVTFRRSGAAGSTGSGGSAGATGTPGSGAAGSAGTSGGSAGATGTAGGGAGKKLGVIIVSQTDQVIPGLGALTASGAVATFTFSAGTNTCQAMTSGSCQLFMCPTAAGGPPAQIYNAGTATITGLAMTVPLTHPAGTPPASSYISPAYSTYLWTASRTATLTVSGTADVPAFTLDLPAPNPISVTAPAPQGSTYTISRAAELAVTWTGGVEGMAGVAVSSGNAASGQVTIECIVAAAAGTVTIPTTFLSMLGTSGGFSVGVSNVVTKTVGDWLIQFQASSTKNQGTATFTN